MTTYINPMNDLGPALSGLADTVATVIDPNFKFKQAMRNKLATDPDLIRQLSSVEDSAPGTLEAMGFGKQLTSIIRKAPIPEKDLIEKNTRPAVDKASKDPALAENRATQQVTNLTPGGVKTDTFKGNVAQAGTDFINASPANAQTVGAVSTTGARPFELGNETSGMEATASANAFLQKNPDVSMSQIAQGFIGGKIPASVISGLYNIPSYGEGLKTIINYELENYRNEAYRAIGMAKTPTEFDNATFRMMYSRWLPFATKIGSNPIAVINYMNNPDQQTKAADLAANPEKVKTDADRELVKIYNGAIQMNTEERQDLLRKSSTDIQKLIQNQKINQDKYQNDPGMLSANKLGIQKILDERHRNEGMPQYYVQFGKPPGAGFHGFFAGEDRFYFSNDPAGKKVVDDIQATSPEITITDKQKQDAAKIQAAYMVLSEDEKVKFKQDLQKQNPSAFTKWTTLYPVDR
jgi:hypothetical protein